MRAKREANIAAHNEQAEVQQKHQLGFHLHRGQEILQCSRCREFLVIRTHCEIQTLTRERCLLLVPAAERRAALAVRKNRFAQVRDLGVEPLSAAAQAPQ